MKKIAPIFLALFLLSASWLSAQSADELLALFSKKLNGYKSVELAFDLTSDNAAGQNFSGTILRSGNKFRLLTDAFEVYSDGVNKWLCNKEADEVYIQLVADSDNSGDITDNPLQFISNYKKDFKYSVKAKRTENGKSLVDIEFTPTDKKSSFSNILLTLDEKSTNPYAIKYTLKDGTQSSVRITRIVPDVEVFDGYFTFPRHKYQTAEIIDLR